MENQKEIWKDVPNYEGLYQVSNLGNVKSLEKIILKRIYKYVLKEKKLNPKLDGGGYKYITLYGKDKRKNIKVHQLVAMAFLGHKPNGYKLVVDHKNNVKTDNRLDNLQLITQRENCSKDKNGYTSKYVGVWFLSKQKKWEAQIKIEGKKKWLGHFNTEEEANIAYQKCLKKLN